MTIKNTIADRHLEAPRAAIAGFRRGPGRLRPGAPGIEPGRGPAALSKAQRDSAIGASDIGP